MRALSSMLDVSPEQASAWVEHSFFSVEGGHATATSLLARGATGIVCGSDLMALGAIRAARRQSTGGVPLSHSVVGCDDSPLVAFTDPPLTTVRQQVQAMGTAAVRALLDAVAGRPVPSTEYVFCPELVVRGSTAAAPTPVPAGVPAPR